MSEGNTMPTSTYTPTYYLYAWSLWTSSILVVEPSKTKVFPIKTRVIWVPGAHARGASFIMFHSCRPKIIGWTWSNLTGIVAKKPTTSFIMYCESVGFNMRYLILSITLSDTLVLLLMEIILHRLGWCWNPVNNGRNHQSQLFFFSGFLVAINSIKSCLLLGSLV